MEQEAIQSLLSFFKVLGNESRLKILGILASRECSVEELATLLQLKEPTVSHHLNKLKALDLVKMRPDGNTHLYQLTRQRCFANSQQRDFIAQADSRTCRRYRRRSVGTQSFTKLY